MKKYFTWKFIKSPTGMFIIMCLMVVVFICLWIFVKPPEDQSKDALIRQLQHENQGLKAENKDEEDYRKLLQSKLETILNAVSKNETEKIKIYERIKIEHRYIDSATVPDLQKWFDARYPESGNP